MKVKVCGMTTEENLKSIIDSAPDFVGFIFYAESSRRVRNEKILFAPTGNTQKVGVFVNEEPDTLLAIASIYDLDFVQLHGDESSDYCEELKKNGLKVIKAFSINEAFNFSQTLKYVPHVDYFLFDTKGEKRGGNGNKFNWNLLDNYDQNTPFFLSGGITEKDVNHINELDHTKLYGVDINSGFEISLGIKEVNQVKNFIQQINS